MRFAFLASFLLGLLLGVIAMLFGVERKQPRPVIRPDGRQEISARLNLPIISSFAALFGATGYLLTRYGTLSSLVNVLLAAGVGIIGVVGSVLLVAKWAVPSAREEVVDDRYLLQGHLAQVTRPLHGTEPGEIRYVEDGATHTLRAVSLDGTQIERGTEVVIERIEQGVAYVEPWVAVERRL